MRWKSRISRRLAYSYGSQVTVEFTYGSKNKDIAVVREFQGVFPKVLPEMSPDRKID
jgi:hypothetical protein